MSTDILVYLETEGKSLRKVNSQLLSVAHQLAEDRNRKVFGLLVGHELAETASLAAGFSFEKIFMVNHEAFTYYSTVAHASAVTEVARLLGTDIIIFANTANGRDLAPRVAQRLGYPMVSDIVGISSTDYLPVFKRPIYAGKAYEEVQPQSAGCVVTVRANAFPGFGQSCQPTPVESIEVSLGEELKRIKLCETIQRVTGQIDLTEADIIVSGGMGVKGPEGFEFLKPLVNVLGAALGSSRAAVNAGWIHPSHQVGQTGKTVSPKLYIACGISGAIQHRAGMSTSKCIVAINIDPNAPIFEIADYGIVGDLFQVVPLLTEEFKTLLKS